MKRLTFLCACAVAAFHAVVAAQTPGRNVNMVSGTRLPDGDPFLQRQNEPSAAVSTRNPLHLLAGANDYRTVDIPGLPDGAENGDAWLGVFKSFNGGQTWRSTLIPGYPQDTSPAGLSSPIHGYQAAADPTVRPGTNGLFYYSGIAFDRGANGKSAVFVSRFIDNNNDPGGDSIAYLDTTVIDDSVPAKFIDKPYLAVDIPRPGAASCTISAPGTSAAQTFAAGTIYLAYQVFNTTVTPPTSKLMITRSSNCGATWEKPTKVKDLQKVNQGVQIAIDPQSGTVYLTWRAFADPSGGGDAVLFSKADDLAKLKFKDSITFPFKPFDQGTSHTSFRTNSYPTIAVDGTGRVYLTWSERGLGPVDPKAPSLPGDARVVMVTSKDGGNTWSDRRPVENTPDPGHQIMPVVSTMGGKVSVVYYDLREDVSQVFKAYVDDANIYEKNPAKRHTLDVRIWQADPADTPIFKPSVRVSDYMMGVLSDPTGTTVEQLQFNVPNLPLFAKGTLPFIGDFIDISGEWFTKDAAGKWAFNTSGPRTLHAFWTDNRDVRPPLDHDWTNYTPPNSLFKSAVSPTCKPGQTGMRNSNIYTSRITPGLFVGSPGNTKELLWSDRPADRRSFVVFAQNNTDQARLYQFTIQDPQPIGGIASFLQFSTTALKSVKAEIAPRSTASRTVYVSSSDKSASVQVTVAEIQSDTLGTASLGLTGSVTLNPDRTNPTVTNPTVTNVEEFNPTVTNPTVTNPTVTNPTVTNPTVTNTVLNPTVTNPTVTNVVIANPTVTNPTVTNPTVTNPTVTNADIVNSNLSADDFNGTKQGIITDTTWTVKNNGNTAGSFSVKTLLTKDVPPGYKTHLLLFKTNTTPTSTPNDCELKTESQMQLVASIPTPTVTNPTVTNPTVTNTQVAADVTNPTVTNASLWLDVGEEAKITFRVLNPDKTQTVPATVERPDGTFETVYVSPAFNPEQVVAPVVIPTTFDTVVAAQPNPTVTIAAPLVVTTTGFPTGLVGEQFSATLTSVGGEGTARTWSLPPAGPTDPPNALPSGLSLSDAGVISGTPTAAGVFAFHVQVTDGAIGHVALADLELRVAPSTLGGTPTTPEDVALPITLVVGGTSPAAVQFAVTPPEHGTLSGTAPNLTYTPASNYNGPDSFTYTATINTPFGAVVSAVATVSITVTPVNDAPSLTKGADPTVPEDAGPQTIQAWATNISAGPPDEAPQTLGIATSNTNPGLFSAQPAVALDGTLTFTPAPDMRGTATVSVTLTDNGPTLDGGVNTATHTFVISVVFTGPPVVTTTSLPGATRNSFYSHTLTADGLTGLRTWSVVPGSGSLPSGISLNSATGVISGIATGTCVPASFTVAVTDSTTPVPQTATRGLLLGVSGSVFIGAAALPLGVTFENYTPSVFTSCGDGSPKTWTVSGTLPLGVGFNTSTGQFTATNPAGVNPGPRQNGTFPLTIQVSDGSGSDSKNLTLKVAALDQQVFPGPGAAVAIAGTTKVAQTITVGASGTLAAVRVSVSPVAPATSCTVKISIAGINPATGAPDDSAVYGSAEIITGAGTRTIPLPALPFAVDSRFAVVFSPSDTISAAPCQMNGPANNDSYFGGAGFVKSGGAWTQPSGNGGDVQVDTLIQNPALSYLTKPRTQGVRSITLNTGKVLIIGTDGTGELFDPATGESTSTVNTMQAIRADASVTLLASGKVLILGGSRFLTGAVAPAPTIEYQATGEIYDPATNTFTPLTATMTQGRSQHSATLLRCPASNANCVWKDTVLIAGGVALPASGTFSSTLQSAEIFNPATDTFTSTAGMATPRNFHVAAGLSDGRVLVAGGFGFGPPGSPTAEIFDAGLGPQGSFAATGGLIKPRARATATLLNSGKVLVAGGTGTAGPPGPLASAELFDPGAGTNGAFVSAGTMLSPRQQHTATPLADGSVLLAGGARSSSFQEAPSAGAERYVPSTGAFAGAPGMLVVRADHGAALLSDGRIAVTGGNSNSGASRQSSRTIEVYDPGVLANGTVTGTPSIANPNLPDGFVGATYGPYTLNGVGGTATPYAFTVVAPTTLPPGVTLSTAGVFSGSPTAPGTYLFDVLISDNGQPKAYGIRQTLRIRVNALTIVSSLPTGHVNRPYSAPLLASPGFPESDGAGGVKPYNWTLLFGSTLPPGLSIDAVTNTLIGTPSAIGSHFFTLKVVDGAGQSATRSLSLFINQPLTITTATLSDGLLGWSYFGCFGWSGHYDFPLTWTITPQAGTELPGDFAFAPNSNCLDSTAGRRITKTGTFTFTVRVTDSGISPQHDEKTYTIRSHAQEQQVYSAGTPAGDVLLTPARRIAQVVTTSTPFGLTGVQLWGISSCSPGMTITADVRAVIGAPARPDENGPLASASVTTDLGGYFNSTLTFPAVSLAQHARVAIVVSFAGPGSCQGVNWPAPDYYTPGHGLVSDNNSPWQLLSEAPFGRADVPMSTLTIPNDLWYLSTYRSGHAAVTLADKRVLLLGNDATAEIFDPVTQTLTPTGSMGVARWAATATLLPATGKVLVAGGYQSNCPPAPAACTSIAVNALELFDPAGDGGKGSFSPAGNLQVGRYQHAATLLADGVSVLLTGGSTGSGTNFQVTQTAEIYHSGNSTVSVPFNMIAPHSSHTATLIPFSSKVLIAGGYGNGSQAAEIFDPATGAFTATTGAMAFRAGHTATALTTGTHQGEILLIGGAGNYGDVSGTTEFFRPASSTFTAGPALSQPRINHTAVPLADGRVVVLGGRATQMSSASLSDVEVADANVTQFARAADLLVDRTTHTASLLTAGPKAGQIFVAGGYSTSWLSSRSAETYNPPSVTTPPMVIATSVLPDGAVDVAYPLTPIVVSGATGPLQFSIPWGSLPAGLSLTAANEISGMPLPGTGGVHSFVLQVTDSSPAPKVASRAFTIAVNRLTFISPAQLPSAAPSQPYSYQLQATGVGGVSFAIEPGGPLPPNFSVTPAGLLTFPSAPSGSIFVSIRARDGSGQSIVKGFSIYVAMPLAITTTSLNDGVAPWSYGSCLSWTGGSGTANFTIPPGTLPYGLNLNGNGCFNGSPRQTGRFTFTAQATDQSSPAQSDNRTLTLRVGTSDQAQHGIDWQIAPPATAPPAITFGSSTALAQVFTPRMNGELLDFLTPVTCSGPLHVEIRAVTSGQPNATVLGSADIPASALGAFPGAAYFRPLAFSSPVFLTSGVPVAAVLSTGPGASCAVTSAPPSNTTQNYSYAWGDAFTGSTGNWVALSAGDATRPDIPFQAIVDEGGRLAFTISWRHMHTATLLTMGDYTGLVLLAGGYSYNQTELYNPTTSSIAGVAPGRFAAGPPLNVGRTFHTATLMADGSVIVIGGFDGSGTPLSSAERLDPVTRVWTPIGSMSQPRFEHTATLLGNGKVLIVGGRSVGWSSPLLATTELLSSDGSYVFSAGPALTSGRAAHAATKLNDGRVLVTGGWGAGAPTGGELYEPLSNRFTIAGPMRFPRAVHVAALLDSGKVLLVGGSNQSGSAPVTTAEVFDPTNDSFLAIPSNEVRENARAVVLNGGKVLIAGGTDHNRVGLVSTSMYDSATQTFSPGSNLVVPRNGFTATRLSDNRVLLVGGCCDSNAAGVSAELFDPATQAIPPGLVNTAFGASVPGDGTASTFVIKSGTLPAGLTLDSSTGAITGLPTVAGIYHFVIEITNAAGYKTLREVTIQINGPLTVSTATLPDGVVGSPYSVQLGASGGGGARSWSHVGSLVPGLNLSADGVIAGTPSAAGSYTFTVQVTDTQGGSDSRQLTLVVDPPWTTTFPEGGVVLPSGLVIDPNNQSNIYALLNWRGIYKSTDSANTWTNVTDATANLWPFDRSGVSFLTVLPGSNTFYAISGGRPFKSTNQGLTWVDLSPGFPGGVLPGYAQTLAVDSTATRLWVSTTGSGLYSSYNGGASWQPAHNGLPIGETVWSLAIDPTNPDVVYAGTASTGVFKTTNAVPFWQPVNGYLPGDVPLQRIFAIAVNPVAPNIVYAAGRESAGTSGVARSVTGGGAWSRLPGNLTLYWQPGQNLIALSPSSDTLFAGSSGNVISWTGGVSASVSATIGNTQVTSVALDQLGGIYAGTNGLGLFRAPAFDMSTWIPKSAGLRGINFPHSFAHSVHVDQSDPSFVYAGSINGGYLSVDAGASWLSMNLPNRSASTLLTHPLEPAALYAFQNDLSKSTDKGQTWQDLTGARGSWNDGDFAFDPNNRQTIYLAATGSLQSDSPGGIYKTTDGGATWQFMTAGLPSLVVFHAIAVHPQDGNVVFAATQGGGRYTSVPPGQQGIYRTTDGGQNWTQLFGGLPTTGMNVNQIVIHPLSPNIMYAGAETTNGGVYKSTDGGNTWTRVLAENVNTVVVDPTSTSRVYAGTWNTKGFYRSRDGGATWTTFNHGLPIEAGIESIGMDPFDPRHLFLGTTAGTYEINFTGPPPPVDLAISIADSPDPATLGNSLVYTIQVLNVGSTTATGVAVSDPLPGYVSFLSAVSTQGSCTFSGGTVSCSLGALAPAQTATITLNTVSGASGQFTNTATVSSSQTDLAPGNNSATAITTAQAASASFTASAGGTGGSAFGPFGCAGGAVATALKGRAGEDMDRTELWCSPFVPNGYGAASFVGAASNSGGGSAYDLTCPAGMALTGVYGAVRNGNGWIDYLGAKCRNLATGQPYQSAAAGAQQAGSPFDINCPTGQAVVGFQGRQGFLLDQIQLICR